VIAPVAVGTAAAAEPALFTWTLGGRAPSGSLGRVARSSKRDEIAGDDWWPILAVADDAVRGSGLERLRRHVQPKYLRDDRLGVKEIAGWYRTLPDGLLQALAVTWACETVTPS
jgi:hypothetical protein